MSQLLKKFIYKPLKGIYMNEEKIKDQKEQNTFIVYNFNQYQLHKLSLQSCVNLCLNTLIKEKVCKKSIFKDFDPSN
jgi:hypothetical protein